MDSKLKVIIDGDIKEVKSGISLKELSKEYAEKYKGIIVLAIVDNKLSELTKEIDKECIIDFVSTSDQDGSRTYKRSASFVLIKAIFDVLGKDKVRKVIIHYSISKGYYCEIDYDETLGEDKLKQIKGRMDEIVKLDLPIEKRTVKVDEAIDIFEKNKMYDKVKLFNYRRVSNVNLYKIDDIEDYFYGYMVPSTGCLDKFELHSYDRGFVIQFPSLENPGKVAKFEPQNKLFSVLQEATNWGQQLNVDTVGALNDTIASGKMNELILIAEALQEKKIAEIADNIAKQRGKRIILIAGPSSSGKTTFSHRLSIQLKVQGLTPHPIPVDDYFVNRDDTPLDEYGNYDFESLHAIDLKQFNEDMNKLLDGEEVNLPTYNFKTGKREYKGKKLQLQKSDILVIEGIHGLNSQLTHSLPEESKYKIYISALTQLNIDEHNRVSTTDGRLIRRMVRDYEYRGMSAKDTIAMWPSVRRGEERNIFPFQEEADIMFNSALVYELAILKQYAEPMLFSIPKDSPEHVEAKRLIKFLDYFLGVSSEAVPKNSIIREFIGGSCFKTH
ncbi:uridine kinase [Natranaerovirga pectinivora]|uniref:Uridine kinase n=1 Tax=Natranaerovirga pectinivora TaxID=682400 RepID=A0A4R3MLK3_9FIRM|nr:nucleoside kinase [Natranaerovirga pectinivora]TCT15576.1 uridine kinase [Natranaerovirga pectinivora]